LFEEKWAQPRYYSLILQPFLVSPAINVGDIAVAMKSNPQLGLEAAMRQMHPFPIFERWVEKDVVVRGNVAVKANTQVIMFTADFRGSKAAWPAFGAGPRACAGTTLALGLLQAMHGQMLGHPAFLPEAGRCTAHSVDP
jgi:cytochrome P450